MRKIENSSNIEFVDHDGKTLTVHFKGGKVYDYPDFPSDLHAKWMDHIDAGGSAGGWFHKHVKLSDYVGKKREAQ